MYDSASTSTTTMDNRFQAKYKTKGCTSDELRKRRRETTVEIRKAKQDELLCSRRKIEIEEAEDVDNPIIESAIVEMIRSGDHEQEVLGLQLLRQRMMNEREPTLERLCSLSIPVIAAEMFQRSEPDVQDEISWVLVNMARVPEAFTNEVRGQVGANILLLLRSSVELCLSIRTLRQLLLTLAFLISCSIQTRNFLVENEVTHALTIIGSKFHDAELYADMLELISQLFYQINSCPQTQKLQPLLPIIRFNLAIPPDRNLLNAVRAFAFMSENREFLQLMCGMDVHLVLVGMLTTGPRITHGGILRALANITQEDDLSLCTQKMVECGLLEALLPLTANRMTAKETCTVLANISADGEHMVEAAIERGILDHIGRLLNLAEFEIRREAFYVVLNCCVYAIPRHLEAVLNAGILRPLNDLLTVMDTALIVDVLDVLHFLLNYGSNVPSETSNNPIATKFEEFGGRVKLEFLSTSQVGEVQAKASELLDTYYNDEDDETAELYELDTSMVTSNTPMVFDFGSSSSASTSVTTTTMNNNNNNHPRPTVRSAASVDEAIEAVIRSHYAVPS